MGHRERWMDGWGRGEGERERREKERLKLKSIKNTNSITAALMVK